MKSFKIPSISSLNFLLRACCMLTFSAALGSSAMAVTVLSETFDGTGNLSGTTPTIAGSAWKIVTTGDGGAQLSGGQGIFTRGTQDLNTYVMLTQALSAVNPILRVTIDIASFAATGFHGINLFYGATVTGGVIQATGSEAAFIGYNSGASNYTLGGRSVGNNSIAGFAGAQLLTVTYNYNTGMLEIFDSTGTSRGTQQAIAGRAINEIRVNSSSTSAPYVLNSLQADIIPEASSSALVAASAAGLLARRRRTA